MMNATRRSWLAGTFLVIFGSTSYAAGAGTTLLFQVRANPTDASPRCDASEADRCRDDLDLPMVFEALRAMTTRSGPSPFKETTSSGGAAAVEVNLGAGTFRLQRPVVLSGWGGAGSGSLLIKGAGADKTILSGTVLVPPAAWRAVAEDDTRVVAAARSHVRVADLSTVLPAAPNASKARSGFGEQVNPVPLDVFSAGRPLTLARWPNTGWAQIDSPSSGAGTAPARSFAVKGAKLASWKDEPDLYAAGYFLHDWAFERIPVVSVDAGSGVLTLQGTGPKFGIRQGQRVFIENALSEVDSPGEWYYDGVRRALYVWPLNTTDGIEVSVAPGLLQVTNSNGVSIQQIGFQGVTGDAVQITQSRNISLTDSVVRNAGNRAVIVNGGSAVALRRVVMTDLGAGGVSLSGGDRKTLVPAQHVIEACRIERFSRLSRTYSPAVRVEGVGIQVLRNRISDGQHVAIVFNGNDHRIEGNNISDVVTETNDAGAIYTGRDWTARGSVVTNNLLQNIYPRVPGTVAVMGIYLDDQASGVTITGNIFANVSRAVFVGGGRDITIDDNLFVASSPAVFADNRGLTWQRGQTADANGPLQRNLRNMPFAREPYRSKYAHLADILDDEPGRSKYNRASGNVFVSSKDFELIEGAQAGWALDVNRAMPWSVFKTLRGTKPHYSPHDFDLADPAGALAPNHSFPNRDGIAP